MTTPQSKPDFEASLKSRDTEEFIDIHFYRPIGYRWALLFRRLGVSPNQITIASIFIGIAAGICYYPQNFWINMLGVFLLIWANSYDSADGQLARLTGQKSELGRILDGACGDFWFITIYLAIVFRLWPVWDFWILVLALAAGWCHSRQSAMGDYFRNVHLHFLKGRNGAEWDDATDVRRRFEAMSWKARPAYKLFEMFYLNYTINQEKQTSALQALRSAINEKCSGELPDTLRERFLSASRPLLKYTNILSFNTRAITLFISVLADFPWFYFVFELTVMNIIMWYMVGKYEAICRELYAELKN
jgi:hypothetical protein